MRITHEADYAVRMVYVLIKEDRQITARELSSLTGVTLRFTLKIMGKLSESGMVTTKMGASGGYKLAADPAGISMGMIIECIDGPFEINHCLSGDYDCTRVADKSMCPFHRAFSRINKELRDRLYEMKIVDFIENT